jgi:threonine dehydrogenase-like Zn-dependent dehydrogenase
VRGAMLYGKGDVRFEERAAPTISKPNDAIVRVAATCVCGSDRPAPVRHFLPQLIDLVLEKKINPGKVFDMTPPLEQFAEGYRAMDERRAIKVLLRP